MGNRQNLSPTRNENTHPLNQSTDSSLPVLNQTLLQKKICAARFPSSSGQIISRSFKNNTAGLDEKTTDYSISATLFFTDFSATSEGAVGEFSLWDGEDGANAGRINVNGNAGVGYTFSVGNGSTTLGTVLAEDFNNTPYLFELMVHPTAGTTGLYDAKVTQLNLDGSPASGGFSASIFNQPITANVINNGQNGNLGLKLNVSASSAAYQIDNINVVAVPEASSSLLGLAGACGLLMRRRR